MGLLRGSSLLKKTVATLTVGTAQRKNLPSHDVVSLKLMETVYSHTQKKL